MSNLLFVWALVVQPRVEFEVASVKPYVREVTAPGRDAGGGGCTPLRMDRARFEMCGRLANIIGYAYGVSSDRVMGGPDFVQDRGTLFRIQAKLPDGSSLEQVPEMVQALLAERFALAVHRGTWQQEMTAMVVAKGGLKMKPAAADYDPAVRKTNTAGPTVRWEASGITMAELAALMNGINFVPPLVDMTGVKGRFQLDVTVHLKETIEAAPPPGGDAGAMRDALMRAVDEAIAPLGLRLELRKGTVDTVVVDRVERTPGN